MLVVVGSGRWRLATGADTVRFLDDGGCVLLHGVDPQHRRDSARPILAHHTKCRLHTRAHAAQTPSVSSNGGLRLVRRRCHLCRTATRLENRYITQLHAWFPSLPFFRCRFAVPVSRCRFRTPVAVAAAVLPWLVGVDDWLASYGTEQRKRYNSILFQRKNGFYGSFLPFTAVTERNFLT